MTDNIMVKIRYKEGLELTQTHAMTKKDEQYYVIPDMEEPAKGIALDSKKVEPSKSKLKGLVYNYIYKGLVDIADVKKIDV